jgi:MFS transporter, DHA1 family, multidrug resistance protein
VGLRPDQYGLIFSACSAAVMSGALLDDRLGRCGISAARVLTVGLTLLAAASTALLAMTVGGWAQPTLVAALLMAVALAFGMTMPNIMNATMQPLPDIAGAVGAAAGSIQLTAGAASSGLVAVLFDGRSALSMAAVMAASSMLALVADCLLARPAERRLHSQAVETPAAIEGTANAQDRAIPWRKHTDPVAAAVSEKL